MKKQSLAVLTAFGLLSQWLGAADTDAIKKDVELRAMSDEMARAKTLQLNNLDKPYFVQYSVSDGEELVVDASLGGLLSSISGRARAPRVEIRVGSPEFDNTNSVFSGNGRLGSLPLDDNYNALRYEFWLASDSIYKAATDQITRKRNALREIADADKTPDLAPAKPVVHLEAPAAAQFDRRKWEELARRMSAKFLSAPDATVSGVRLRAIISTFRVVNTEGTLIRIPQNLADVVVHAEALTPEGNRVWNYQSAVALTPDQLPDTATLEKMAAQVAADLESLTKAPVAEDYAGPVLFEQQAAAQMLASTLTDAVRLQRKPIAPPGSNAGQILESVWSSKMGAKVLPEWLSVVDDPLKENYQGIPLAGSYTVDDEGVPAQRVTLVDKGVLKGYLSSREPIKTINESNGHGRLPGPWGTELAVPGNLLIEASETTKEGDMKAKLLEKVKAAGLKYGLLIRRLDYPSSASGEEIQSMGRQLQKGGISRTLNSPLLAYRVYPDGREELVRGLRFKDFSAKDLRDISLASDKPFVFNFVTNGSAFNHADSSPSATTMSVVAPSLLFDSLELSKGESEPGKLPIVPAPVFTAQ